VGVGVHLSGDELTTAAAHQRQKSTASCDQTRHSRTDDGAGHGSEYRDAANTRRAGVQTAEGAGERHKNIAVEGIYRDRMRTCGVRQVDGLQNVAVWVDHVEEPLPRI